MDQKGFTMIELIAVMLIISIITVMIVPKLINLEVNAEKKLFSVVISEMNVREHMAYLDCKLKDDCTEYVMPDFSDIKGLKLIDKLTN